AAAGDQSWALALDLLRETEPSKHPSIAHSPAALTISLGLSYKRWPVACEPTLTAAIHALETGDALHQTLGASVLELRGRALPAGDAGESAVELELINALWDFRGSDGPVVAEYGAAKHHIARPTTSAELAAAREVINCVVEQQTRGLIVDFLPEDYPKLDTTAFDTTVAFLGAPWETGLRSLPDMPFTGDDGLATPHAMMGEQGVVASYFSDGQLEALELPLRGGALSVLLVLPAPGVTLESFVSALSPEALRAARDGGDYAEVDLAMPKFSVDNGETLDYFKRLGLMCEEYTLRSVLHRAVVRFDEQGVEAAAASANESWDSEGGGPGVPITIDRPFLFFIYDHATGFALWSGRYAGA
ncbi:MAG: hypothetical protein KC468_34690, partial [Myxococcales bacterium]|nr:hypothetical protein [Myxococcales bacterium]